MGNVQAPSPEIPGTVKQVVAIVRVQKVGKSVREGREDGAENDIQEKDNSLIVKYMLYTI